MKKLYSLIITASVFLITIHSVFAYDPPEVIGEIYVRPTDFSCGGDQNGDGYDDILARYEGDVNRLVLFYGGERLSRENQHVFDPLRAGDELLRGICFLGRISPESPSQYLLGAIRSTDTTYSLDYFRGGDSIAEEPFITQRTRWGADGFSYYPRDTGLNSRPSDFNGDGYDDVMTIMEGDPYGKLQIYFGGEEFDTIPDWEYSFLEAFPHDILLYKWSSGYDVNGDGSDDVLIKGDMGHEGHEPHREYFYELYLGGNPMDTIPAQHIWHSDFESVGLNRLMVDDGFTLLPDVNGDGYDDWGIWWKDTWQEWEDDGFFIYFGGEEPDFEPDISLEGHRNLWVAEGHLVGGDFNGDGYGDVAGLLRDGVVHMYELHIHFGGRWMDENTDIYLDMGREYNGRYSRVVRLGAVGDYNGDGVDDFAANCAVSDSSYFVIFAGSRDWAASTPEGAMPLSPDLDFYAWPNPFNGAVNMQYHLRKPGKVSVKVYDVQSRLVDVVTEGFMQQGFRSFSWSHSESGVYFVIIDAGGEKEIHKIVCLN